MENNRPSSLAASAGKVAAATAFSRVLGLIREQVTAYYFGAGLATDAFVAAFRIPNLLRDLFAEGALSSAFVPIFKDIMVKEGRAAAFQLANITLSILTAVVGLVVVAGMIFSPEIIYISAHGFMADPEKFALTVAMTRLMFVFLLLVSLAAVAMGILNSLGNFGIPALASAVFNLGMIIMPVCFYSYFKTPIYTLAIGVLLGGLGQLFFQVPWLWKEGFRFRLAFDFAHEGIRRIFRLISPMILGLSASRLNILISTLLASLLAEGAMSYLNYSYRLMHFPLGVFAVALGTVALPRVSEEASRGQFEKLIKTYQEALGWTMFLVIPSAVYLAGFGHDLVRLIYERGAFSPEDTLQTSRALFFYSVGLLGFAGVRVAAPAFYALGDSKNPMYYSVISVAMNIILNFAFMPIWGFAGLAAANAVAGLANLVFLMWGIRRKLDGISYREFWLKSLGILAAALTAWAAIWIFNFEASLAIGGLKGKIVIVMIQCLGMAAIYLVICRLLKFDEVGRLWGLFHRKK